jgi:hypothetical protein
MKKEKHEMEGRHKHNKTITKKKSCSSKTYPNTIIFLKKPKLKPPTQPHLQNCRKYEWKTFMKAFENRNKSRECTSI